MKFTALIAALLAFAVPAAAQTVRTEGGMVAPASTTDGVADYKAIPFAAAPVGALRWRAPRAAPAWSGVRTETKFAALCMQGEGSNAMLGLASWPVSEDCLYLNVWTPVGAKGAPVMVWIHGGSFTSGGTAIPAYAGAALARKGVVVVTIAYRLGAFGFLSSPGLSAESGGRGSGNYGLMDQIAALKWVKRNIAAFGGDPARVTIFGESAGGISVSMLTASPAAKGLFARAISESGASFEALHKDGVAGGNVLSQSDAEKNGTAFLKALKVRGIGEARALPAEAVLKTPGEFWPVADGQVVLGDQWKLYAQGRYNDTPVLIGTNADEGALFVPIAKPADYAAKARLFYGPWSEKVLAAYPYTNDAVALRSARDLFRDVAFAWPTWSWARLQAKTGKGAVYIYDFAHSPPWPGVAMFSGWGPVHGSEIGYVFGTLSAAPYIPWKDEDRALSETMMSYWVNFAATGDPNGPGLAPWPAYTTKDPAEMRLDIPSRAQPVANLDKLKVLDGYFAWRRAQ